MKKLYIDPEMEVLELDTLIATGAGDFDSQGAGGGVENESNENGNIDDIFGD